MLKRFGIALTALAPVFLPMRLVCAENESKAAPGDKESPVDAVLKKHPPVTPQEIRGQLTTPEGDL